MKLKFHRNTTNSYFVDFSVCIRDFIFWWSLWYRPKRLCFDDFFLILNVHQPNESVYWYQEGVVLENNTGAGPNYRGKRPWGMRPCLIYRKKNIHYWSAPLNRIEHKHSKFALKCGDSKSQIVKSKNVIYIISSCQCYDVTTVRHCRNSIITITITIIIAKHVCRFKRKVKRGQLTNSRLSQTLLQHCWKLGVSCSADNVTTGQKWFPIPFDPENSALGCSISKPYSYSYRILILC